MQTEAALMFDALYAFTRGLTALQTSYHLRTTSLSCSERKYWTDGQFLANFTNYVSFIKLVYIENESIFSPKLTSILLNGVSNDFIQIQFDGLTGNVEFKNGRRVNV